MSDQWFYQAFGEEHGPVSFEQLREMASKHQLTPHDHIRSADVSEWQEARSLPELFPYLQNADEELTAEDMEELDFESLQVVSQEKQPEWSSLEELDIQVSDAPTHIKTASHPTDSYGSRWEEETGEGDPGDGETVAEEDQWICDVLGVQLGPMPMEDLRLLARKGEIGLDDPVRRSDQTEWKPAKTVEGLFPGFEFHSDVGLPEVASSSQIVDLSTPSPDLPTIGDDFNLAIDHLSSAELPQAPSDPKAASPVAKQTPESAPASQETPASQPPAPTAKSTSPPGDGKRAELDKWLSDAVPSPPPPAEKGPEAAEAPAPLQSAEPAPSMEDRAAQLKAEYEARTSAPAPPPYTPPTPPKKVKSSGPGMGDQLTELLGKLKGNPAVLGVIAVVALVALFKFMPWPLFGPSDQAALDTITTIGKTVKEMQSRNASAGEFDSFKKESLEKLTSLKSALLDAGAGINDRPKQELYWACGKLERMMGAGVGGDPDKDAAAYDKHIATAQALINGQPPPTFADEAEAKKTSK